jgi:hypothetical protein
MKCQSDFDNETEKTLRQADECVEPWWEGKDAAKPDEGPPVAEKADVSAAVAEEEAVRRGLLRVTDEGETCLSCQEESAKK